MPEEKPMITRLYDATDNLVDQQFYLGGKDVIIGRTPEIQVKIRHSGQIISKFKDLFKENIKLFLNKNYRSFLNNFMRVNGINESLIKEIHKQLQIKLEQLENNLDNSEDSLIVIYTIVLSAIITKIREIHFEEALDNIREKITNQNSSVKKKQIDKELTNLFMRNNENISILYNLSYLHALAKTFNYRKVKRVCSIQRTKFINNSVDLIKERINSH